MNNHTNTYPVELKAPDISAYKNGNTGVNYVHSFDSGASGPHVMINAVTHGNEIAGAITVDFLLRNNLRPLKGKLTLGFANVAAFQSFDPENPNASRCIDEDYNRVWVEDKLDGPLDSVELRRAREIRPIYDTVDYLLDIHTMGTDSDALTICNGLDKERVFTRKVGYPELIVCGSGHVQGKRLIEYTPFNDTNTTKVAILVECGQHWAAKSGQASTDTALYFLKALDIVDPDFIEQHLVVNPPPPVCMVDVTHGIHADTDDFKFVTNFMGLDVLARKGTVYATDGAKELATPYDNCMLVMPNQRKSNKGDRVLRLAREV